MYNPEKIIREILPDVIYIGLFSGISDYDNLLAIQFFLLDYSAFKTIKNKKTKNQKSIIGIKLLIPRNDEWNTKCN